MLPIVLCPVCLLQIIVLAFVILPILFVLGKVFKIRWADKSYTWCIKKIKAIAQAARLLKKKEKEEDQPPCCECGVKGCENRRE